MAYRQCYNGWFTSNKRHPMVIRSFWSEIYGVLGSSYETCSVELNVKIRGLLEGS